MPRKEDGSIVGKEATMVFRTNGGDIEIREPEDLVRNRIMISDSAVHEKWGEEGVVRFREAARKNAVNNMNA